MQIYSNPELFHLWRDSHNKQSIEEVKLLRSILTNQISTLVDIGGADGVHTIPLSRELRETELTIFDGSKDLLNNAKSKIQTYNINNVTTQQGYFEDIPEVLRNKQFDAAISMWTTITYVTDIEKRRELYKWLSENIHKTIIIDQSNFYTYKAQDKTSETNILQGYEINTTREYQMNESYLRTGSYTFTFTNLKTQEETQIYDPEEVQFIEPNEIDELLSSDWVRTRTLGKYDINTTFDKDHSKRLITIHQRQA